VVDPPTEAELAAALREPRLFAVLGRWVPALRWELAMERKPGTSLQTAINRARLIASALRIRTGAELLVPAFADHSWSTIAAITDGRCTASVIEDVPMARRLDAPGAATQADLEWVWPRLTDLADLLGSARFRLAMDALTFCCAEPNPRLAAVLLWTGVEAAMACGRDQGFRLAAGLAALLEPRGPARRALYERALELDAMGARVVLSEMLSPGDVEAYVRELRALLSRLLSAVVEARRLPTAADLDRILLH
jgi:hypothetical protein